MKPPEVAPTRARIHREQPGLPWSIIILVALAALSTTDLQAQEWRFDAIDRRFVNQQRAIDQRLNRLDQQIHRLHQRLSDHSMSQLPLWGTKGAVDALREIVRGLPAPCRYPQAASMTPLEAAYAAHEPGSTRFLNAIDFVGRYQVTRTEARRIALESDSAAVWERTWKDETWWQDGEGTGGSS